MVDNSVRLSGISTSVNSHGQRLQVEHAVLRSLVLDPQAILPRYGSDL